MTKFNFSFVIFFSNIIVGIVRPNEFRITNSYCFECNMPRIMIDKNEIIIFWNDRSKISSWNKYFAKKFNIDGIIIMQDAEFELINPLLLGNYSMSYLSIGFVVTYTDFIESHNIYLNIYDKDLNIQRDKIIVSSSDAFQLQPTITKLNERSFVVSWVRRYAHSSDIYSMIMNNNGDVLVQEFKINSEPVLGSPMIHTVIHNSGFAAMWNKYSNDIQKSYEGVYIRFFNINGSPLISDTFLSTSTLTYECDITSINDKKIVIVWVNKNKQIIANLITDTIKKEFIISDGYSNYSPKVFTTYTKQFVVYWIDAYYSQLSLRIFDEDGDPLSDVVKVNNISKSTNFNPDGIPLPDGKFMIVWQSVISKDRTEEYNGIYSQIFDSKGNPYTPLQLNCKNASFSIDYNKRIYINLKDHIDSAYLKILSLPSYGNLIDKNSNTTVIINEKYYVDSLEYENNKDAVSDNFTFSSVDDNLSLGSSVCNVSLAILHHPMSHNFTLIAEKGKLSILDFSKYIVDTNDTFEKLKIMFNSLPLCGKLTANQTEVSKTVKYETTNQFVLDSFDCQIGSNFIIEYVSINSMDLFSKFSYINVTIIHKKPEGDSFIIYVVREGDNKFNFSSHIRNEENDLYPNMKIQLTSFPSCGGKLYVLENSSSPTSKPAELFSDYDIDNIFAYKTANCNKNTDVFTYHILDKKYNLISDQLNVKIEVKIAPTALDFEVSVIQNSELMISFENQIFDPVDTFEQLILKFLSGPVLGKLFDKNKTEILKNVNYNSRSQFFYYTDRDIDAWENISYIAVNSFNLHSAEKQLKIRINPKLKSNPFVVIALILAVCVIFVGFLFSLYKFYDKGYCCWKRNINPNINGDQLIQ